MTRHKKFVKSEKAKTKLKGAKLPKGLNVTKTDFKIRKIVIRDQIRGTAETESGLIVRSSNIKELISKLQHHNSTNRNEGLRYLKDLMVDHPQEASKHLGTIIQGVCQLALDIEKDVRRECFKAVNVIFATQTPDLILPFFNVITSYLRCAMTHINIQIQEDSLNLLDCLLLYTPTLVASNSDSIFSCFLDMISKLRTESKPERTLTVNLGSKQTSVKWRSKVLDRLLGILKAIVNSRHLAEKQLESGKQQELRINQPVEDAFRMPDQQTYISNCHTIKHVFDSNKDAFYTITRGSLNNNCDLPFLFRKTIGVTSTNATNLMADCDEGQKIRKYAELLMPLLFETWMEVRPTTLNAANSSNDFDNDGVYLTNEAASTLKTIAEIIEQLIEMIQLFDESVNNDDTIDWYRRKYGQEFVDLFLAGFPYHQGDGYKGSKRKSKGMATEQEIHEAGGQKCYQQNLNIAHIFCRLNKNLPKSNQSHAKQIIEYVRENVSQLESQNQDVLALVVKLLRAILIENAREWLAATPSTNLLLVEILATNQRGKLSKDIRPKVLSLICDIVSDSSLSKAYGKNTFDNWISTLPTMLCQSYISWNVLKRLSALAQQRNAILLKALESNRDAIIDNLPQIKIIGLDEQMEGKQQIVNLFFWLRNVKLELSASTKEKLHNEWHLIEQVNRIKNL